MLSDATVTANIPAADLARARRFYADMLGLTPDREGAGGMVYRTSSGSLFFVYQTEYAGMAGHTIAQLHVDDLDLEVKELQARGVTFEHYDLPGVTWDEAIATVPEMGRAAWFKDSEGNILCIDDADLAAV
jgi:predicted enzyme related to lactoylglutathione lyase